jgi:hypothetical protein
MSKGPKILFYDIETTLLLGHYFRLGKQVLRHSQTLPGYFSRTHIICIAYRWLHEDKSKILTWGNSLKDEKTMIQKFDKLVEKADVVIGKNSNRFDNKHINSQRLWHDLAGAPQWTKYTDDLEQQMRKHFYLPSYSLDYLSEQLGLGGKRSMSFQDWVDISFYRMHMLAKGDNALLKLLTGKNVTSIVQDGKAAQAKMYDYNVKDTDDTVDLWNKCVTHFEPKFNRATFGQDLICKSCGSSRLKKNGVRIAGQSRYQEFFCNEHGGYAGRASISATGKLGKIS